MYIPELRGIGLSGNKVLASAGAGPKTDEPLSALTRHPGRGLGIRV